jgi:hypothetical protein
LDDSEKVLLVGLLIIVWIICCLCQKAKEEDAETGRTRRNAARVAQTQVINSFAIDRPLRNQRLFTNRIASISHINERNREKDLRMRHSEKIDFQ